MGFVQDNLKQGEEVVYHGRLHWAVFTPAVVLLTLSVLPILLPLLAGWPVEAIAGCATVSTGPLLLIAFVAVIDGLLKLASAEIVLTSQRGLAATSWSRERSRIDLPLATIEELTVDRGFLGRLLNYGTAIITTQDGRKSEIKRIADPFSFRDRLQQLLGDQVKPV